MENKRYIDSILKIKFSQFSLLSQIPFLYKIENILKILKKNFIFLNMLRIIDFFHLKFIKFFFSYQNQEKKEILIKKKIKKKKKNQTKFVIEKKFRLHSFLRYRDFAGIDFIMKNIQELIEWPLMYSTFYKKIGICPNRGILFKGPPGTGKTLLAHIIAGELGLPFFYITPSSIASSYSGESEKKIQKIFYWAKKLSPSIIFIDEIDTVIGSRESLTKETEKKIIGQLLICIDKLDGFGGKSVIILGATNKINSIDASFRRPGRFDRELEFKIPDFLVRFSILKTFSKNLSLEKNVDLSFYAEKTFGFVSGDLSGLVITAGMLAISRIGTKLLKGKFRTKNVNMLDGLKVKKIDFDRALNQIEPSMMRNGFTLPSVIEWKNIGGLNKVRKIMSKYIIEPIKKTIENTFFKTKGTGVLLFGPPGCGKTLIAKAVAHESKANFISIKGPEIFDKFLGESEKAIRFIFSKARSSAPSIIFFDEIDSIATKRTNDKSNQQNGASERILNQLLTEMDGNDFNESIYVIGATNRPNAIDKAVLRPGRIDKFLFVSLPNKKERTQILETVLPKRARLPFLELRIFSEKSCSGFSGADLDASVKEGKIDAHENKILYCKFHSSTRCLFVNCIFFLGSTNFLNGIETVKKNLRSTKFFKNS